MRKRRPQRSANDGSDSMLIVSKNVYPRLAREVGTTLLEVLVTIVIMASGLLGLAALQVTLVLAEAESYQRAQAILLVNDMVERITTNRREAVNYVSTSFYGVTNLSPLAPPSPCLASTPTQVTRDLCDWSRSLQGAAETVASGPTPVGGLQDGRGCVETVQAEDASAGVCVPGVYRVTVAWQGANRTTEPAVACGSGLYGGTGYRRAISTLVSIGLPSCPS